MAGNPRLKSTVYKHIYMPKTAPQGTLAHIPNHTAGLNLFNNNANTGILERKGTNSFYYNNIYPLFLTLL